MSASLHDVPLVEPELESSCVAACVRIVLAYWGDLRTEQELRDYLGTGEDGTKLAHLDRLATLGYEVRFYETNTEFLELCLETKFPPIVPLATDCLGYWKQPCRHAAVLVGIDNESVTLNDPWFPDAPQIVPLAEFLRAWEAYDRTVAVILPPTREG